MINYCKDRTISLQKTSFLNIKKTKIEYFVKY